MNEPKLFDESSSEESTPNHDWKEEWKGMPEYVQEKKRPYATIIVRLESKEDLEDFAKRIGQKLTQRTKSIWHPQLIRGLDCIERWADEA